MEKNIVELLNAYIIKFGYTVSYASSVEEDMVIIIKPVISDTCQNKL